MRCYKIPLHILQHNERICEYNYSASLAGQQLALLSQGAKGWSSALSVFHSSTLLSTPSRILLFMSNSRGGGGGDVGWFTVAHARDGHHITSGVASCDFTRGNKSLSRDNRTRYLRTCTPVQSTHLELHEPHMSTNLHILTGLPMHIIII